MTKSGDVNQILEIRDNKLIPILDCLQAIGVACMTYKSWELLDEVRRAFYHICHRAQKFSFPKLQQDTFLFNKIWIWQQVICRVYSLGAILVLRSHWEQAQRLIQQEIDWDDCFKTQYWSRYVLTMAARAHQMEKRGWVPSAVGNIESREWLPELFMSDKDEIVNAVCQFDFLQCVYTNVGTTGELRKDRAYPSFGLYHKFRTEPVIGKLISPGALRDTISQVSDAQLAILIHDLDELADSEFFSYNGWISGGWSDKRITKFLHDHPNSAEDTH